MFEQKGAQATAAVQRRDGSTQAPGDNAGAARGWRGLAEVPFDQQVALFSPDQPVQRRAEKAAEPAAEEDIGFYPTLGDLYDAAMRFKDVKGHHFEGAGHDALVAWLKAKPRRVVALSKVRTDDVLAVGLPTSEADLDACTDAMASITEIPTSLAQAREWGVAYRALRPLVEARGNDVLDTYVFLEVVRRKAADKIMHYFRTCAPGIDGGHHDVMSMLAMIAEGVDYAGIRAALPSVHNVHRFEGRLLTALVKHWGDTSKSKPLTVILHSSVDYNGGFHRDPFITEVGTHGRYVTVLIEGKTDLASAAEELRAVAASHGQGGKVANVIIAGHGSPTSIELTPEANLESRPEEVEGLDDEEREKVEARNKGNQALLDAIAETTAPDGQVVLDACLTNAADPDAVASHDQDPDKLAAARKGMAKTLAQDVLGDADGQRVLASQAATGGTDMVRRGGRMQLDVKGDKAASKSDRYEYIAKGTDLHGLLYAVLDAAASDVGATRTAVEARLAKPVKTGMEPLFAAALQAALPCLDGARAKLGTLRALFEPCQSVLLYDESSCRPAKVAAALSALSRADGGRILRAALALPYNVPLGRVALHVVEVLHYGGDVVDLIDAMADPSLSCRVMRSVVNPIELVPLGAHKVTPGSPGSTRLVLLAAKLKLAAVRPQVEALLLGGGRADIGPQLGSAALAELEGFATAHEILDGVGIR